MGPKSFISEGNFTKKQRPSISLSCKRVNLSLNPGKPDCAGDV